jgi:serine protease Do
VKKKTPYVLGLALALAGAGGYCASQALVYGFAQEQAARDPHSYREVVKRVLPAVVSIEARPKVRWASAGPPPAGRAPFRGLPGLPDELRKELERFGRPPLLPPDAVPGRAFGSGFIVDPSGVILTNDHVIRGADVVEVLLQDGRKFTSRDIRRDPRTDLAVVRIKAEQPLPALKLGDSDAMEIGDRVLAIGAPLGMTGTVTSGIISAKGRALRMNQYEDFLQTDAAINPGNSGGPLVNLAGEVVGINAAIRSETGGSQGIGLAISSNLARSVTEQLQRDGTVRRGYLGVQAAPLAPEVAARLGLSGKGGVVVARVLAGSPAAKGGLQDGDVLTEVAGRPVQDPRGLQRVVAGLTAGKQVQVSVVRDGARKVLTLTVENQPETFGHAGEPLGQRTTTLDKVGIKVMDVTPKAAQEFGHPEKSTGVLITEVAPESVAATAGLTSGVLILQVDRQPVRNAADVQKALEKGSPESGWLLQVRAPQGGVTYVLLRATPQGE